MKWHDLSDDAELSSLAVQHQIHPAHAEAARELVRFSRIFTTPGYACAIFPGFAAFLLPNVLITVRPPGSPRAGLPGERADECFVQLLVSAFEALSPDQLLDAEALRDGIRTLIERPGSWLEMDQLPRLRALAARVEVALARRDAQGRQLAQAMQTEILFGTQRILIWLRILTGAVLLLVGIAFARLLRDIFSR